MRRARASTPVNSGGALAGTQRMRVKMPASPSLALLNFVFLVICIVLRLGCAI
jgi:hypothetical protein